MTALDALPDVEETFLPFHVPTIEEDDIEAVADALRSGWLTHGVLCQRFERDLAEAVGARRGVALSSGTAAMHLALVALGIGPGDEVITTPFTFCSTAHVIEHVGAIPVLVDIEPVTMQIDPAGIERAVTERTRAILPVHYGGHPCDMDRIGRIADARGLPVVEDAAHALGATIGGRPIGSIGTVTAFSFYATKNITTGEGGMLTTDDDAIADRVESLRLHGISRDAWKRYDEGGSWFYEVIEPGYKANLTDFQAALGLSQLAKDARMRARRTTIAERYSEAFGAQPDLFEVPVVAPGVTSAWHLYPLRLRLEGLAIDRDAFIRELQERRVGVSVHFIPLHLHPHFRERFGYAVGDYPRTEEAFLREISLPIYPAMSDTAIDETIRRVRAVAVQHAR